MVGYAIGSWRQGRWVLGLVRSRPTASCRVSWLSVAAVYDLVDYQWGTVPAWKDRPKPAWVVLATRVQPGLLVPSLGPVLTVWAEGVDPEHGWGVVLHDEGGRYEWPDPRICALLGVDPTAGQLELGIPFLEMLDQNLVPIPRGVHSADDLE